MFTFCEVVTNVTVGRIGMYDGHVICVCFTNVRDCFETPLKLFVPILCKHCESTIVAVGGIRVKIFVYQQHFYDIRFENMVLLPHV